MQDSHESCDGINGIETSGCIIGNTWSNSFMAFWCQEQCTWLGPPAPKRLWSTISFLMRPWFARKKRPPVWLKWGASFHHWLVMIIIPALKSQFVYTPVYCVLHFQKHPLKNMRAPQVSAARCTAGAWRWAREFWSISAAVGSGKGLCSTFPGFSFDSWRFWWHLKWR